MLRMNDEVRRKQWRETMADVGEKKIVFLDRVC